MSRVDGFNVGEMAWFVIRDSKDQGWLSVKLRVTRVRNDITPVVYEAADGISAPEECVFADAGAAYLWISKH